MATSSQSVGSMVGRCGALLVVVLPGGSAPSMPSTRISEYSVWMEGEQVLMSPRFQDVFMYGIRELVGHFHRYF